MMMPCGANHVASFSIKINLESVIPDFALTVGIDKKKGPLAGGVKGKMAGIGANDLIDIMLKSQRLVRQVAFSGINRKLT